MMLSVYELLKDMPPAFHCAWMRAWLADPQLPSPALIIQTFGLRGDV